MATYRRVFQRVCYRLGVRSTLNSLPLLAQHLCGALCSATQTHVLLSVAHVLARRGRVSLFRHGKIHADLDTLVTETGHTATGGGRAVGDP